MRERPSRKQYIIASTSNIRMLYAYEHENSEVSTEVNMKPEVKNWFEQAEHDIDVAEYNFDGNMLDVAAFYSQQAAEKALKSLYISKFNELWRVHDLVRIAKRVEAPTKIVRLCAKITPAYTSTRYPDICKEYDRRDVEEILRGAKEVLEWVKQDLNL